MKMNPVIKDPRKDDVVGFLNKWPNFLVNQRTMKTIAKLSCGFTILQFILCLCSLLSHLDAKFWKQYFFIASVSNVLSLYFFWVHFSKHGQYLEIINTIFPEFWSLQSTGNRSYQKIKTDGKVTIVFIGFYTFSGVFQTVLIFFWFGGQYAAFLEYRIVVDYFNKWLIYVILLYVTIYHRLLIALSLLYTIIYTMLHLKFQCFLLNSRLEELTNVSKCVEFERTKSEQYQRMVRQELITCIKLHYKITEFATDINKFIYYPLFFVAAVVVASFAFLFFLFKSHPQIWYRFLFFPLCGFCFCFALCSVAQILENESERIQWSLYDLPWYTWNNDNRKLFLCFLHNTQKSIVLSGSGVITLNYRLLITICKCIYSAVTIFMNFSIQ